MERDQAISLALTGMRRVAVVGASADVFRASNSTVATLRRFGYEVVGVNPNVSSVHGVPCYDDLASVPGRVDVVDVFRRTEHLPGVAADAVARDDVAVVWNQLGLFSPPSRRTVLDAGRVYVEHACLEATIGRAALRPPAGPRLEHPVVMLDLDDTVLDHDACERGAAEATLAEHGLPCDAAAVDAYVAANAAQWRAYERGEVTPAELRVRRWVDTLETLGLGDRGVDVARLSEEYLDRFATMVVPLPGAVEAVWWLARRCRVAVVTNGFADTQRSRVAAAGISDLVECIVSADDVGVAKPDPAPLVHARELMGATDLPWSEIAVVGDRLATDVVAGAALGAFTVLVAPPDVVAPEGAPTPDVRVERLADLA